MKNKTIFSSESITYPGEFVPVFKEAELQRMISLREPKVLPPLVNITETPDAYRIEVAMPGVERGNILLLANGNTISVMVINNPSLLHQEKDSQQHEFDYDCLNHKITLAADADIEFASAVCHSGMLRIYIPKSTTTSVTKETVNIIVY